MISTENAIRGAAPISTKKAVIPGVESNFLKARSFFFFICIYPPGKLFNCTRFTRKQKMCFCLGKTSRSEVIYKRVFLKSFAIFTDNHLFQILFFNRVVFYRTPQGRSFK